MQLEYVIFRVFQEFSRVELRDDNGDSMLGGKEIGMKVELNTKPAEPVVVKDQQGVSVLGL